MADKTMVKRKKDKQYDLQKETQKIQQHEPHKKARCELRCARTVSSSCSASDTHCVTVSNTT